jgi:hypothetical protein
MKKNLKKLILATIVIVCFGISNNAIAQFSEVWSTTFTPQDFHYYYVGCENMDNDANKEIVYYYRPEGSIESIIIVDGMTGTVEWNSGIWYEINDTPEIIDVNNNGKYELVFYGQRLSSDQYKLHLIAFNATLKVGKVNESNTTDLNNFPNPFSQATTIRYTIPNRGLVSIKIYDFNGNELKSLVNMVKESGDYELTFDGSTLPIGTYFYQLVVGDIMQAKKMLIIK